MELILGVDVGQRQEFSAICAVEVQERNEYGRDVDHFLVRRLERIPAGTPYPDIARRVGAVVDWLDRRKRSCPDIYVDATGLGQPIIDLIDAELPCSFARPVYFNYGDRRTDEGGVILLGKGFLVTRLQTHLQADQLHLPRTPEAEELARDLRDYEIRVDPDANERYGAFRVGRHDDLVTALGLAVHVVPARWRVSAVYL
jgi:hypothetical protein